MNNITPSVDEKLAFIRNNVRDAVPGKKLETFIDGIRTVGSLLRNGQLFSAETVKPALWRAARADNLAGKAGSEEEEYIEYEIERAIALVDDDIVPQVNGHDQEPPPPAGPDDYGSEPIAPTQIEITSLPPLTLNEWRARELPDPDFIMGYWLTTTSRVLLTAATGLGKTNFGMVLGMRIAAGMGFLHWDGRRPCRVLYIDGEMSRRLLRQRLLDEEKRTGTSPETFFAISHEDIPAFKPLNTAEGRAWLIAFIKKIGGVDLIIFDSIMCLTIGNPKDPEPWQQTLPLALALTKNATGQLWVHHTGHDETRSYGDKAKEWQMDTTIHLDAVTRPDTDISFSLKFVKARERTPATRADFQEVKIALVNDQWEHELTITNLPGKVSPQTQKALQALVNVLAGDEGTTLPGGRRVAKKRDWQRECVLLGLIDPEAKPASARSLFSKFRRELVAANLIACEGDLSWRNQ